MINTEGEAQVDPKTEGLWRSVLTVGHRHNLAFLPGGSRCSGCHIPMKGPSGAFINVVSGRRKSRKNPSFCNYCDDHLPLGGAEVDVAVVFADVRGSTGLAERLGSQAFAALLNRFYRASTTALMSREAMIDKLVGDEVMALFFPNTGADYRARAVLAAAELLKGLGYGTPQGGIIPVGVGVNAGPAFCGRIGTGEVHDFTALGDTINTGARLQGHAEPGQIVIPEELYPAVAKVFPDAEARTLSIRGREMPFAARILKL
jgi:adenylate cyclase